MINFTKVLLGHKGLSGKLHKKGISCLGVFNTTKRCNLTCKHCYISADNKPLNNELSTVEAKKVLEGMKKINIGMVLFSGGEPLLRNDLFDLIAHANKINLKCAISTNGTMIDLPMAKKLKKEGVMYSGISIDGDKSTHDKFRGKNSFDKTIDGLINCRKAGLPAGVRFTLNKTNHTKLPNIFQIIEDYKITRFCMYHLVYSGRGDASLDISPKKRRKVIDYLIKTTFKFAKKDLEILTVDNPADGPYLHQYISKHQPDRSEEILNELRVNHGRCSAGERIVAVSPVGDIYNCQFWNHRSLGNVRKNDLVDVWKKSPCATLNKLRNKEKYLKGKCGICNYKEYCGGCRLRARAVYGDPWQEDPACYLTKKEVTSDVYI